MAQLGSGGGSSYPAAIDTIQTFQNSPVSAPDSSTRIDAEVINDKLAAIRQIEVTLGANPQGNFGSLAARLQQFLPGGGASPLSFGFATATAVDIPGTTHNLGTDAPLIQVYDDQVPRAAIEPTTVAIDTLTYDVHLAFVTPQSGAVALAAPTPQYTTTFTTQTTVTILGTTHNLGTADLLVRIYTTQGTTHLLTHPAVTVHPSTFTVVVTFATAESGAIVLSNAGPRYATSFTNQTSVSVPGATHALGTPALLFQVFDAATPRAVIRPNMVTVHPSTFDVVVTFVTPQSGRLVFVQATAVTGEDFDIRDGGVTDSSAVRVFSENGALHLQMGPGDVVETLSKTGTVVQSITTAGNLTISGTATKPGGGDWLSPSDLRLKKDVEPFTDGLAQVLALEPVWYRYNGLGGILPDGHRHSGFVAQDVEAIAPYMIRRLSGKLRVRDTEPVELLTLDTEAMLPLLVNTIKTLVQQLEAVEQRLTALEATLSPPSAEEPS